MMYSAYAAGSFGATATWIEMTYHRLGLLLNIVLDIYNAELFILGESRNAAPVAICIRGRVHKLL